MATVALFPLAEVHTEIFPVDATGNVGDLGPDGSSTPALELPAVATSLTGRGRSFGDDLGLVGSEAVAGATKLLRDCTVRGFLRYALDQHSIGDKGTLVARGVQGSAAERILFGVEFEKTTTTKMKVRARWQEGDGTDAVVAGVEFTPPDGEFFHVGVVRRWLSTSEVEVEYVINEALIGSETVTEGDLDNGVDGTLTIGAAGDGSGDYERFLPDGTIVDSLSIESDAMSFEELRQEFRRITVHQPSGYRILRAYMPPGKAWSSDATSRIQRWLMAEGDGIGNALAAAERLREDFLPDRAYGAALAAWERITGLSPGPSDTIAARRTRVLGFLRTILGYQIDDIKSSLEPLFGLASADIEILEYDATRSDTFGTDDITTPPSDIWITRQGDGVIAISGGDCNVSIASSKDVRWPTIGGSPPTREASLYSDADGATIVAAIDRNTVSTETRFGLYFRNVDWREGLLVLFRWDGSFSHITTNQIVDGVVGSSTNRFTGIADPFYLRVENKGAGKYDVSYSSTAIDSGYGSAVEVDGPAAPLWAGFGGFMISGTTSSATDADFEEVRIFEPNTTRAFHWQAYRDPALGGTYDLDAAQSQLEKQRPAHTRVAAVESQDGFALGPTGSGRLGIDPLMPANQIVS